MHDNLAVVEDFRPAKPSGLSNIRVVFGELRNRHAPDLVVALIERIKQDHDAMRSAAEFIVATLSYEAAARARRKLSAPTRQTRAHHREERVTQAKAIAATVRVAVTTAVLDKMFDGKPLREHTGAEVARLGSGLQRLAARVPASALVGQCVTEAEAQVLVGLKAF